MSIIPGIFGRKQSQKNHGHGVGVNGGADIEPMNVDILEPFIDAISLTAFSTAVAPSPFATASMDWKETPSAHVFITDLPGVKKEEVKIEVEEEKILKISGQRARQAEEKGDKWHRVERGSERFLRSVRLPPNANADTVQASLENGVLTVTVPKDQDRKAYGHLIPITN